MIIFFGALVAELGLMTMWPETEFCCTAPATAVRLQSEATPQLGADDEDLMALFHRHQSLWTAILAGDRIKALQIMNEALEHMVEPSPVGDQKRTPTGNDLALR